MLLCYYHIKGLTLKPVRAGQGLDAPSGAFPGH